MNKKQFLFFLLPLSFAGSVFITGCTKDDNTDNNTSSTKELQKQVLSDFVNTLVLPAYATFKDKATALNNAVIALANNPTEQNQLAARNAWRDTRVIWEQSEGFLIGPVEDDNYDPYMDTWPTDHEQMNALLDGDQELTVTYLESETSDAELTLRGFHPLEYLLWGTDGKKDPSTYTDREKEYMTALAQDILNNVTKLNNSWTSGQFGNEITSPGINGSRYSSNKDALKTIAEALIDICSEVGESKMLEPFSPQPDSTITESPYSHNSIADFKNNITGAYNVYTCTFGSATGKSLSSLVAADNKSLDNELRSLFTTAIGSFDAFSSITFEKALYDQRSTVQNTLDKIEALQTALNEKLIPHLDKYIRD